MSFPAPKTVVCAGGGGVGKTTTSAAIGLALARRGAKTLVVTVDPARRLASAMGVEVDADVHEARVEPGIEGNLFALMPEPRRSTRTFIDLLFEDEPEAKERMLKNRVYRLLADAAAGMHEVVSLMLVARAIEERAFDYLVVDTAPSRQGLDFVSYPGRLATLYEGRAVGWLGRMAGTDDADAQEESGGLLAAGRKRIEQLFGRLVNPRTLRDLAGMFAELAIVKDRFARLARISEHLLLGPETRYSLVAAPSGSAASDVRFLNRKLKRLGQRPTALVLNRADPALPPWLRALETASGLPAELGQAIDAVHAELSTRQRAGDLLAQSLGRDLPGVPSVRLPTLETRDPSRIVRQLADLLAPELGLLAGVGAAQ
ncbi:MAG TPA: ArsA-related P-loop ATPase [Sandaracinaceae bacterium LLY-WYZ-13_1]|nr:ArsA-related P-loop ATPase [Sandaracinaceae bacterium LLY-WYZ-13_1]